MPQLDFIFYLSQINHLFLFLIILSTIIIYVFPKIIYRKEYIKNKDSNLHYDKKITYIFSKYIL